MKRKKEKSQYPDPSEYSTYQTGSTTPPKKYSLLLTVLLVLVIFLAGLCSILGLINIKMFSIFYEDTVQKVPVSLDDRSELMIPEDTEESISQETKLIGIAGEPITPVYQRHFRLPEGLFITYVAEDSNAYAQGIREGDVLLQLGDQKITEESHISSFLENRSIGETFQALIYRKDTDSRITLELTVEQAFS